MDLEDLELRIQLCEKCETASPLAMYQVNVPLCLASETDCNHIAPNQINKALVFRHNNFDCKYLGDMFYDPFGQKVFYGACTKAIVLDMVKDEKLYTKHDRPTELLEER